MKNKSDDLIFQSRICVEASQIPLIAESESEYSFRKLQDSVRGSSA